MIPLTTYRHEGRRYQQYARSGNVAIFECKALKIYHTATLGTDSETGEETILECWETTNPEDALNRFSVEIGKMPAQSLTN